MQPGETLAAVARRYHVSVADIARANRIANVDSIRDGKVLAIPARPPRLAIASTLTRRATVRADRTGVRLGPGLQYRRVDMCDLGTNVLVTGERDGWAQVTLDSGRTGWIRHDFVKYGHGSVAVRHLAAHARPAAKHLAAAPRAERHRAASRRAHTNPARIARMQIRHKHVLHVAGAWHVYAGHHGALHHVARHEPSQRHGVRHYAANASIPEGADIVRTAYAYRGTPYRYGAAGRGGFDCSGFTSYIYGRKGVSLPHSARGQFHSGHEVSRSGLKAGDLVFFHTVTPGISHVGMYVGNGKFVHASSRRSGGVRVDSLSSGYYSSAFRGARRVRK
jgi:cell wall-associated NlpC family hydrolase